MGNLGDALGALLGACDMSLEIYGTPSPALMQAIGGMDIVFYSYFGGL